MSDSDSNDIQVRRSGWLRRLRWPLMLGAVALVVVVGALAYLAGGRFESTDDAEVGGARVSVSSSVSGRVVEIDVKNNQYVKAGQVLFRLDGRPQQASADQAAANLASARLQVGQLKAAYAQRLADLEAARSNLAYLDGEARRARALAQAGTGTEAQAVDALNQASQARERLAAAKAAADAALTALGGDAHISEDAHPLVRQAAAALARARLDQTYLDIVAPQDGVVTKVDELQTGDYVNAGATVFSLVAPRLWIEANFKENQLEYMRPGQSARVRLDAYPDLRFDGKLEAITPGTGSSFSLLPAENATGNWVKVTQRVPVRIVFDKDPGVPLEPGLSATVRVDTGHKRHLFGGDDAQ